MTPLALVDAKTALDLILVAAVVVVLLLLWHRQDRKEKRRRVARKERQAQYKLDLLRGERRYREAQRLHGVGR